MNPRRVAILIDGGFFLHRLPKIVGEANCTSPEEVARWIFRMCRAHIQDIVGEQEAPARWLQHVYRIFYYDAIPYEGKSHHPILNRTIDYSTSDQAQFRRALFDALKKQRKVALRLGKVTREGDWTLPNHRMKKLLATQAWLAGLNFSDPAEPLVLTPEQRTEAQRLKKLWMDIRPNEIFLLLRQKGVDMRIGLDISSIALKKQADTIVLVSGDSDFVPAAKLARREGMEIILDPLWQNVHDDLFEHIDGLHSGLWRRRSSEAIREDDANENQGEV